MPTQNQAEDKFLKAMRDYVDFRFLQGVDVPALENADLLVDTFKAFLRSRPGVQAKGEIVAFLVGKMEKMAESRGTGQPRNEPPEPGQ